MKELFSFLLERRITPNGLFTLYCLHKKKQEKDYVNYLTELHRLIVSGHVEMKGKSYQITNKGLFILQEADKMIKFSKSKIKVDFKEWEENILKYNNIFPNGKKEGINISFRSTPKELLPRFIWFFNEYPEFSWEEVFKATETYVKGFEQSGDFKYMQLSKYFIKKDDQSKNTTSTLAQVCYDILNGVEDVENNGYCYYGD